MRLLAFIAAFTLLAQVPRISYADDEPAAEAPSATATGEATPLDTGEPAPFAGILLPEALMIKFLEERNLRVEAELRVEARNKALKDLEDDLAMAKSRSWWDRNGFWFGAATGAATVILVIWGTASAIDTLK